MTISGFCRKWNNVSKRLKEITQKGICRFVAVRDKNKLIEKIADRSVVSFDVFDTAIKRDVLLPKDVFTLVEKKLAAESNDMYKDFASLRMTAEKTARALNSEHEVTLEEIYAQIPGEENQKRRLLRLECETELALSTPNLFIKRVYDACVQQGKKILFISDMYLPVQSIEEILKKNGYTQGDLYVSCESGLTKRDGRLFAYVRNTEKLSFKDWAHIGDALCADYLVPKRLGIQAILIERDPQYSPYVCKKLYRKKKSYRQLNHFISTRIGRYADPYEQIGYAVLGPLLYGFSCWLERMIPKHETVVFLAREGALFQKAFEIVSVRPSAFLYISRRAANLAKLAVAQSLDEISQFKILTLHRKPKAIEIANHFGLSDQEAREVFEVEQIDENVIITNVAIEKQVLEAIWTVAKARGTEQHRLLQEYLEQLELSDSCALVDVGWHGTMQVLLSASHYQIAGTPIRWSGYYLGALDEGADSEYSHIVKHGFLFEKGEPRKIENGIRYTAPFLELLFLPAIGSTIGYKKTGDGTVSPVSGELENCDDINTVIGRLQSAGLQFVRDISASLARDDAPNSEVSCGNYCALAEVPSGKTLSLFSNFNTEDGCLHKLLSEHSVGYYLMHPKQFVADFKQKPGKTWFLKSVFKIPLPYTHMISFVRKVFPTE